MTQDLFEPGSFVTFGELLKHLRHRARLTQRDLGTAVGYSFSTISKIEANERLPDVAVIRARFVEALGLERSPALANRLLELARVGHGVTVEAGAPVVTLPEHRGPQIPMMGRGAEFQSLRAAWAIATSGKPQLAIITGEAGIGKTRLAEELMTWARRQGAATAIGHPYAAEGALAYSPVQAWLREPVLLEAQRKLDPLWLTEIARLLPEITMASPDLPRPGPLTEG